jgi:Dolichyl-phosphate-mannose-protein mannosyltransferase
MNLSGGKSRQTTDHPAGIIWRPGGALILAAGLIYSLHLKRTLGASEAYTALTAGQASLGAVIRSALRFDPGKPPLYPVIVHGFIAVLGNGEVALRLPSVIFAMISVGLLLVLGAELFEGQVGFAAALLWALTPLAVIYGQWARMYAMLIALSLGQFLVLWRLRSRPSGWEIAGCGLLGAAMLYTHLGSALFIGSEAVILARATWRGERSRAAWLALVLAAVLFLPFLPIAARQMRDLVIGHWLDWIGPAQPTSWLRKVASFVAASGIAAGLILGPRLETDDREPIRWCAVIGLMPIVALTAVSIAIRPMFAIRYIAPSAAMLTLLITRLLLSLGERRFRLAVVGIVTALVCLLPFYPWHEPWSDMARVVSRGSPKEPVFFESGYVASEAVETDPQQGFPQGFFRVPFDRYFSGSNPRIVVDPSTPAATSRTIGTAATARGGAWLITGLSDKKARTELPAGCFGIEKKAGGDYAGLYHVVPLPHDRCNAT